MRPGVLAAVAAAISSATGRAFAARGARAVGGGCINQCDVVEGEGAGYFVKRNGADRLALFEAEAEGLRALAAAGAVRVPAVVALGTADREAFLVLELLELGGPAGGHRLGRALAALHAVEGPRYGFARDNFIGASPQRNGWSDDWAAFFRERRLAPQLELAERNGLGLRAAGERLLPRVDALIAGRRPRASLVHGDLWGGNQDALAGGEPVLFDPAVYYGDAETDLAMTELFGGFSPAFYAVYREIAPAEPGYPVRRTLYNLYHVLNHANLFGGGCVAQARRMMEALAAQAG